MISRILLEQPSDFTFARGAAVVVAPLNSLRSGNPGTHTSAAARSALSAGATVKRISLAYRYDTGFGSGVGTNFTLRIAGTPVYASPHYVDYDYGHNRTNFSHPVSVDAGGLSIAVPASPASLVEFDFDNNDKNLQLLLPLELTLECSGTVPCIPAPPPPPARPLVFGSPNIVSGPECPTSQGGGPWWDKMARLSDSHSLGWAESHVIATTDSGRTWNTLDFNDSVTCPNCDAKTAYALYPGHTPSTQPHDQREFKTIGIFNETEGEAGNITGEAGRTSTHYFLDASGNFARRSIERPVSISNLPNLRMIGGSGEYITLEDGSMVGISKSTLSVAADRTGRLSAIATRSTDGGYTWTFAAVVASAEEVPYASEGPSEGALTQLRNGTLMAVMRCDGQSGHYAPYISKLSDDGGLTWHSLRSLRGGGSGGVSGAGCVRPRLLHVGNSLVLAGGRPNPLSRDVLLWLNAAGDGEEWEAHSVSYYHNLHNTNPDWVFPQAATNNSRSFPRITTSYTSLISTGNASGYVLYGMGARSFTLPFSLA